MEISNQTQPVWCIVGPTASGKSAVAAALAQRWPIEIINVDSATIYRDMDIGTAKPSAQEQLHTHHHLLDIIDPSESYSVARFKTDVQRIVNDIRVRQRIPLMVGGTMMYFNALSQGLHELPSADATIRQQIESEALIKGWPAMHHQLSLVDRITAARLAPQDSQRIQRALEVWRTSGKPLSSWLAKPLPISTLSLTTRLISLEPSNRLALHQRIENRFDTMLAQGLIDEVSTLLARGDLHADMPSIRCVGYRQIWGFLQGKHTLAQAREQSIAATRQLAKRQLTWLRSMQARQVFDCLNVDATAKIIDTVAPTFDC